MEMGLNSRRIYSSLQPIFPNISNEAWVQIAQSCEVTEYTNDDPSIPILPNDRIFILQRSVSA